MSAAARERANCTRNEAILCRSAPSSFAVGRRGAARRRGLRSKAATSGGRHAPFICQGNFCYQRQRHRGSWLKRARRADLRAEDLLTTAMGSPCRAVVLPESLDKE